MDKPEWCPEDVWCDAFQVASPLPIGELGQKTLAREVAKAILSAQERAYIDAARIADGYADEQKEAWDAFVASGARGPATSYESLYRGISAAILQRKEEIGR